MPNWCSNNISIEGPKDKITALWESATANDGRLLNAMVPMPQALRETTSPTPQPGYAGYKGPQPVVDGVDNWYDWAVKFWGTKWDVDVTEGCLLSEDGTRISGWMETAWAPPLEAFQTYIENNDDVSIRCSYFEGGCDFAGVWTDGADEGISPSDYTAKDFLEADRDSLIGLLDEEFGIGETMAEYEEIEAEENRRDEKNGVYPEHEDVAN